MENENKAKAVDEAVVKKKRSKKPLIVVLLFFLLVGGLIGYYYWDKTNNPSEKISGEVENNATGRKFVKFNFPEEHKKIEGVCKDYKEACEDELAKTSYKEDSLLGGQVIWGTSQYGGVDSFEDLDPQGGKLDFRAGVQSLRAITDEAVHPDEVTAFNQYWSAMAEVEAEENKTLSDAEIDEWIENAKQTAIQYENPAAIYIGDLLNNLKGKQPTLQSVYYLLIANRISPLYLSSTDNVVDYSSYLDRSYQGETQEKSLVNAYTDVFERLNTKTGLVHWYVDGSWTEYAIQDFILNVNLFVTSSDQAETKNNILEIAHYKDVSNQMLAEYFVGIGNQSKKANEWGLGSAKHSFYKPAFTWCISPKIEKIASAYYDIVEPLVYQGKFNSRQEAYAQTKEALDNKYTVEEIQSAIMTYEFWALQE
ncbi:MAG: hypothetical protein EOM50_02935 [Erysipelotrichia bacterium]|nr:hypothetical protein [Erysipelotrichia bacterium]